MGLTPIIEALDVLQAGTLGANATDLWGDNVIPTVKLMGIESCSITPVLKSEQILDKRGSLAPAHSNVRTVEEGSAQVAGVVSYDDVPYWLDAIFGTATPATDANGTITRTYSAPLAEFDSDLAAAAIYGFVYGEAGGNASDTFGIDGATLAGFDWTFETGAPSRFSASFFGKQVVVDALETLADRSVELAMGDEFSIYIDTGSDDPGTTEITATAFSGSLSVQTNRAAVRHLGNLTPDSYRDNKWSGSLSLSLELTATMAEHLEDIMTAGSDEGLKLNVRIKSSRGASASARHLFFDFIGVQLEAPEIYTYADGVRTLELNLTGEYLSTFGNWLAASSMNAVETLA